MIRNLLKNHMWIETGIEALVLAVMFEYMQIGFVPIRKRFPPHPFADVLIRMSDPYVPLAIGVIATFGIVVSVWGLKQWNADVIRNGLFMFLFLMLTIIFTFHEIGQDGHIGAMTLLSGTTLLRIVMQWLKEALDDRHLIKQIER